jgi:hypothetical protein
MALLHRGIQESLGAIVSKRLNKSPTMEIDNSLKICMAKNYSEDETESKRIMANASKRHA